MRKISEPHSHACVVLQFAVIIVSICFLKKGGIRRGHQITIGTCMLLLFVDGNWRVETRVMMEGRFSTVSTPFAVMCCQSCFE